MDLKLTVEQVKEILKTNKHTIVRETRNGNDLATVLTLSNGCIVNCWDSGKVNFQGKNVEEVNQFFNNPTPINEMNKKVFVVYGHDTNARTQLEAMLRRWDLEPLILDQLVSSGQTIIEKLESLDGFDEIFIENDALTDILNGYVLVFVVNGSKLLFAQVNRGKAQNAV